MKEIQRYTNTLQPDDFVPFHDGEWCKWADVEALKKALDDMTAKAIAAVWLLPENVGVQELRELREEARDVFLGKDKQVIAKLQDELRNAQEAYQQAVRPHVPGVNSVHGFKSDNRHVGYALMITRINHAPNGGLVIEVALP